MDAKYWIDLLMPLIGNGILLFGIQHKWQKHMDRKDSQNNYRKEALTQFTSLLQEYFAALHDLRIIYTDPAHGVRFADVWNPAQELMQKLVIMRDKHPVVLKKANKSFDLCVKEWNRLSKTIRDIKYTTGEYDNTFCEELNASCINIQTQLRNCLTVCEKELLKL